MFTLLTLAICGICDHLMHLPSHACQGKIHRRNQTPKWLLTGSAWIQAKENARQKDCGHSGRKPCYAPSFPQTCRNSTLSGNEIHPAIRYIDVHVAAVGILVIGEVSFVDPAKSEKISALRHIIHASTNIVFFGGAGVSTESNIPDFRSANGLFSQRIGESHLSPEEILSHTFFQNDPKEFFDFYKNKMIYKDAKPNHAHLALAKLEQMGKLKAVITQNIDGLHQEAGSKEVLELHGSVKRNYCMKCNHFFDLDYVLESDGVPTCNRCGGIVKPDVVLYEESLDLDTLNKSIWYIENAEVLIVAGTSLRVYPAAGLIRHFAGKHLVLINQTSTPYDHLATLVINERIGETLKACLM